MARALGFRRIQLRAGVVAGIAAALLVGSVSPDVVAVKARKRSQDGVTPAEVPRGRGRVVSLRERRLADLPATNRRYPPWRPTTSC